MLKRLLFANLLLMTQWSCNSPMASALKESAPFPTDTKVAQNRTNFAYRTLSHFIANCLWHAFERCQLSGREKSLLQSIEENLAREYRTEAQIEFRSETQEPGFFFLDNNVRIAKTFPEIGSYIYFNLDLMYQLDLYGKLGAIDIGSAVAVLIHEMGHHHAANPEYSHEELDILGAKVKENNAKHLLFLEDDDRSIDPAYRTAFVAINKTHLARDPSEIWFLGSTNSVNLTEEFLEQATCPNVPSFHGNYVNGFSLFNGGLTSTRDGYWQVAGYGMMVCQCRDINCLRIIVPEDPRYAVRFRVDQTGISKDYRDQSFRLETPHSYRER